MQASQHDADARWQLYEQVAGVHRVVTAKGHAGAPVAEPDAPIVAVPANPTPPAAATPQESRP